jgi:hypothetical protein
MHLISNKQYVEERGNVMHLPSDVCPQPLTRAVTPAKSGEFGLRQGSFAGLMKSETFTEISEEICCTLELKFL